MFTNPDTAQIREILGAAKKVAVVGISNRDDRASRYVSEYLQREGYEIFPVNPDISEWQGIPTFKSVSEIPEPVDVVDVFRRSIATVDVAKDVAGTGAKVLWLQQGIYNEETAQIAQDAGMTVVMDKCIMVEHKGMKLGL